MKNVAPLVTILLVATVAGCRTADPADPAPPAEPAEAPPTLPADPPADGPSAGSVGGTPVAGGAAGIPRPGPSPAELYASCEERVEQPEADGECTTDADCVRAGCSQELCVTARAAAELMSTCEVQPCFDVLDACGCVEGRCRWSLEEAVTSERPPVVLPGREAPPEDPGEAAPEDAAPDGSTP